jgi:hypothetical protein
VLEGDRAVVRSCLNQVETGMAELRGMLSWWQQLGSERQRAWMECLADVRAYQRDLSAEQKPAAPA